MSIWGLPRTYGNLKRFREIAVTLARHGFSHVLGQLRLAEHIPGLSRIVLSVKEVGESGGGLSTPERLTRVLQDLGATFIKFGQLLATRPDLIPSAYAEAFARLQDSVTPLPTAAIHAVAEKQFGKPVSEVFASFADQPTASGSIGQVHCAELKDGTSVVVKIKRPDTDSRMREDLDLLAGLAGLVERYLPELAMLRPRIVVEEFSKVMERELDFIGEASYTAKFAESFAADPEIYIPTVYWEYVTRDTLVLENIDGVCLTAASVFAEVSAQEQTALATTLGRCFMRQFFETGFFHADPHPGNIIRCHDGRVALIDFGQMGHLSGELRRQLALAVFALSQGDTDFIVDIFAEIGAFTEHTNLREFKSELAALVDRHYAVPLDRLDMREAFHEALSVARKNGLLLPRDFVLLGKSFVTVLGVIRQFDPGFRFDGVVRPFVRDIFGNLLAPKSLLKRFGVYGYKLMSLLRRAPDDARDLLEKAKSGQMRIIFHHEGLEPVVGQFERAANRLALGLIIAALTVGSAIVFSAGDQALGKHALPYLGESVPLSAVLAGGGFLSAAGMGTYLAWAIFRSKRL